MSPLLAMLIVGLLVAVPVALAAAPPQPLPAQRVDMKVLLIGASTTDGVYDAWKTELERAGVPFDSRTGTAAPLTDAKVADYAANRAKYQAVIVVGAGSEPDCGRQGRPDQARGDLRDPPDLATRSPERRPRPQQPHHGRRRAGRHHRPAHRAGQGRVPLPQGPRADRRRRRRRRRFGYQATPARAARTSPRCSPAPNNSAYLGINVRANGTEEMVNTVPGNQFQSHHQLLRDGMLDWVTRGVYLGYARNYLGLDVDDVFLPDDKWDPVNNVTDYNADASAWTRRTWRTPSPGRTGPASS